MELIGIENTVLTKLFLATRPQGQPYLPHAAMAFVERYKFAGFPTKIEELVGERVSFKHGLFDGAAFDLDIFSDGVIASSKSPSDVLDAFLADVTSWMEAEIGLKKIETHAINTNYESYLVLHSSARLLGTLDRLSDIQTLLAQSLKTANGRETTFHPVAMAFSPDNTTIAQMRPIPFRIERRAGVPFEANYYYSCAPLRTADHLQVLEQLEKAILS